MGAADGADANPDAAGAPESEPGGATDEAVGPSGPAGPPKPAARGGAPAGLAAEADVWGAAAAPTPAAVAAGFIAPKGEAGRTPPARGEPAGRGPATEPPGASELGGPAGEAPAEAGRAELSLKSEGRGDDKGEGEVDGEEEGEGDAESDGEVAPEGDAGPDADADGGADAAPAALGPTREIGLADEAVAPAAFSPDSGRFSGVSGGLDVVMASLP